MTPSERWRAAGSPTLTPPIPHPSVAWRANGSPELVPPHASPVRAVAGQSPLTLCST